MPDGQGVREEDAYESIGRAVRSVARGYLQAYRAAKGEPVQP